MARAVAARRLSELPTWPAEGLTRVPVSIHSAPEIYGWVQDRVFRGPFWNFLCLEVEIPAAGEWIITRCYQDEIVFTEDGARFRSRNVVWDSTIVDTLVVIPV